MITKDDAIARLQAAADELRPLSYEELEKLADALPGVTGPDDEWREYRQISLGDEKLYIHALIGSWGLRRRVSVELEIYNEDGTIDPSVTGCVYFERFKSGKYAEPTIEKWHVVLAALVAVAVIVAAVFV